MKECGIFDGMNVHPIWWNDCKHRFSQPISRLFQFCLVVVQVCDLSPRLIGRLADRLKSLGVVNGPRRDLASLHLLSPSGDYDLTTGRSTKKTQNLSPEKDK
jgi:hypothetical protein